MRILIVEDDFTSRLLIQRILAEYGDCDIAVDGEEAIHAFKVAHEEQTPYQLICLDIMMPKMDGSEALKQIRKNESAMGIERLHEVKVIMTTSLNDVKTVVDSYKEGATAYVIKPVNKQKLLEEVKNLKLLQRSE